MSDDIATKLRNVHKESKPRIARIMDEAEILAATGKYCRENGIDWAQLKALIKAEIKDERDESGEGDAVTKILDKADAASAYADLLFRKMNDKKLSSPRELSGNPGKLPTAPERPVDAIVPSPLTLGPIEPIEPTEPRGTRRDDLAIPDDLSIPKAFRRVAQEAAS